MKVLTKICSKCEEPKDLKDFGKAKRSTDGLKSACKECHLAWWNDYTRTKEGLVKKIYKQQLGSSKRRGHPKPSYTCEELTEAILAMPLFHKLYDEWVASGYKKDLIPSIDRDDNFLPYTEDNITLMTWEENRVKNYKDQFKGNSTRCKPIVQLSKYTGVVIRKFKSTDIAARVLELNPSSITNVLKGKYTQTGGYKFRYA